MSDVRASEKQTIKPAFILVMVARFYLSTFAIFRTRQL